MYSLLWVGGFTLNSSESKGARALRNAIFTKQIG
jgi:hypothetical protein